MDTTSQRGASTSVGTSQEERDRNVLRLAPEKKAWMPPKICHGSLVGDDE
uniref:Uncharacterized protein n=1 Tax=Peronospora matthiolae TaxID=2874970 RepID=A0AAV1T0Q3_9STRA